MDDIQKLNQQKEELAKEAYRLSADGNDASHVTKRIREVDYQLELAQQKQQSQSAMPTEKEIRQKQNDLNAATEASLGGMTYGHTRREAESALLLERSGHAGFDEKKRPVEGQGQSRADEIRELAKLSAAKPNTGGSDPKRSQAQWTQAYEVKQNADRSVSYNREGQERFVDRGASIGIKSNDERSIKNAVSLAREKWGNEIQVTTQDHQKREAIFKSMAEQKMQLGNKDEAMQKRYAEIQKSVERERLQRDLSRPQRVEPTESQSQRQAMAQ